MMSKPIKRVKTGRRESVPGVKILTGPFESQENRISIAFDIVPLA